MCRDAQSAPRIEPANIPSQVDPIEITFSQNHSQRLLTFVCIVFGALAVFFNFFWRGSSWLFVSHMH